MYDAFSVTDQADIEIWCSRLAAANAPQLPLYRAAADLGLGVMFFPTPATPWPADVLTHADRPVCIIVGADLGVGGPDPAPSEWACARQLKRWCVSAIVHGAGGTADQYRMAAIETCLCQRLAFIETTSRRMEEWVTFLNCPRTLLIRPTDGLHPVAPAMGERH